MDVNTLIEMTYRGLLLSLWICLPTVLAASAVGLLLAVVQATTQLQDQTSAQMLKLFAACAALALSGGWAGLSLLNFVDEMLRAAGFAAPSPIL